MRVRRVTEVLIALYLWGFILYQITPVRIIPSTNYAPKSLSPMPVIYRYAYAYDVKSAFSHHAGSIRNLIDTMERMNIDFAFGDFPEVIAHRLYPKPRNNPCVTIRTSRISLLMRLSHLVFEEIPNLIFFERPEGVLSRLDPPEGECYVVAHDGKVWVSTYLGFEVPPYSFILGSARNVFFSRDILIRSPDPEEVLRSTIVLLDRKGVTAFAYSERSFYLPGEATFYDFRYVVETDVKNPLIYLFYNGELFGVYAQRRINLPLSEEGAYRSVVMSYRFRISVFYFGLRTVALVPPVRLM
ncbi:MAG: hypothetical protein Q9N26_02125 [Aquificota bacterium]|nr:hypothetical protein [Aquificota bacterium]